jgi:hypothetical protein
MQQSNISEQRGVAASGDRHSRHEWHYRHDRFKLTVISGRFWRTRADTER